MSGSNFSAKVVQYSAQINSAQNKIRDQYDPAWRDIVMQLNKLHCILNIRVCAPGEHIVWLMFIVLAIELDGFPHLTL